MPICHDKKFLYVHIPRTAGKAIYLALTQAGCIIDSYKDRHLSAGRIRKYLGDWGGFYKFSVIRNPWERYVSAYLRMCKQGSKKFLNMGGFSDFIHRLDEIEGKLRPFACSQMELVEDIDDLWEFSEVNEKYAEFCKRIGIKNFLTKENGVPHRHYSEYYDKETKDIVAKRCKREIEYFEYRFVS